MSESGSIDQDAKGEAMRSRKFDPDLPEEQKAALSRARQGNAGKLPNVRCPGCDAKKAWHAVDVLRAKNAALQARLNANLLPIDKSQQKVQSAPDRIYVMGRIGGDSVKIGISFDPYKRLQGLVNDPEDRLRVLFETFVGMDARAIERYCHERLSTRRISGNGPGREWFRMQPQEAVSFVKKIVEVWKG